MASRRSRLKAVANLPIRRKPLSVQQEVENSNAQEEPTAENNTEAAEKEQETKECDENSAVTSEIADTASSGDTSVIAQSEPDKTNTEEVSAENNAQKIVKPTPGVRFGRRVKPSVSLAVLKDRTSKVENKQEATIEEQTVKENLNLNENAEDCVNKSSSKSDDLISSDSDLSKTGSTNVEESASLSNGLNDESADKSEASLTPVPTVTCDTADKLESQIVITLPVIGPKQDTAINGLNSGSKTVSDVIHRQRSEVLSQRNLSENSQLVSQVPHLQLSTTGVKKVSSGGVKQKKPKFNDFARKVADARREFQRKYEKIPPDRNSLRMIDLIFYNPSTNPMESKAKLEKRENHINEQELLNERVDDPDAVDKASDFNSDDLRGDEYGKMPVPQVKIGLNGEIILDEKSLVIETTGAKKGREDLQNSVPVFEDRGSKTCYYKRKTQKSRDWSDTETKRFYKALNTIGTDFSLMQKYFPVRTRLELKNKFKREEKLNRSLVDRALNNPSEFDITQFEKYLDREKQIEEEESEKRLQQRKMKVKKVEIRPRTKSSVLGKEVTETNGEEVVDLEAPSDAEKLAMKMKEKFKKANEINILSERYALREERVEQQAVVLAEVPDDGNNATSKLFTDVYINEITDTSKIRYALEEINNVEKDNLEPTEDNLERQEKSGDLIDDFYQAVVNLSASLKSRPCKTGKSKADRRRQVKPSVPKGEKRKASSQQQRKTVKKQKDCPYMNTLDIETYDSKCESDTSSNESNDNSFTSTQTISGQDFIKLLTANAQNMKESKIQLQITDDCSSGKNVEIILDSVPSITLSEI
ncbi:UNVERIFIED_CONTAM: hypothetical protein PYX00_000537 [Menopon gallinae]|uniref:Myb-like domain-containing protein n=1 Tax=Menopon gallinae TaxID=328185 RepID=A0AAW2I8Z2_9NEOP